MANYLDVVESHPLVNTQNQNDYIEEKLRELYRQKEAFSPNTFSKLVYTARAWGNWCQANGRQVLPVLPDDIKDYIKALRDRGLASTTINSYKTMLNLLHRHLDLQPITTDSSVRREMRITSRRATMGGERVGQAIPLHRSDLIAIHQRWHDSDKLVELRNLAAIFMAYNTMLRFSELARIKVGDLTFKPDGTILIYVGYTKTIAGGEGVRKVLGRKAAKLLTHWLETAGLMDEHDAYVLSPVTRFNRVRKLDAPMTRKHMEKIFSSAWYALDKEPMTPNKGRYTTWTGHSCRVGAAQDLYLSGESLALIMHEGTWKDPRQAMSYLREIEAQCSKLTAMMNEDNW